MKKTRTCYVSTMNMIGNFDCSINFFCFKVWAKLCLLKLFFWQCFFLMKPICFAVRIIRAEIVANVCHNMVSLKSHVMSHLSTNPPEKWCDLLLATWCNSKPTKPSTLLEFFCHCLVTVCVFAKWVALYHLVSAQITNQIPSKMATLWHMLLSPVMATSLAGDRSWTIFMSIWRRLPYKIEQFHFKIEIQSIWTGTKTHCMKWNFPMTIEQICLRSFLLVLVQHPVWYFCSILCSYLCSILCSYLCSMMCSYLCRILCSYLCSILCSYLCSIIRIPQDSYLWKPFLGSNWVPTSTTAGLSVQKNIFGNICFS